MRSRRLQRALEEGWRDATLQVLDSVLRKPSKCLYDIAAKISLYRELSMSVNLADNHVADGLIAALEADFERLAKKNPSIKF
jgi:hypothetical protein